MQKIMHYILFLTLLSLSSCNTPPKTFRYDAQKMHMRLCVQLGHTLPSKEKRRIIDEIEKVFERVDLIYNHWNPQSEISHINTAHTCHPIQLSPELYQLLEKVDQLHDLTEGKFDPTVAPIVKLWKTYLQRGKLPPKQEIDAYAEHVGWHLIQLDHGVLYKADPEVTLNLDGIAKGLAIDLILEKLNELGYTNIYVEWGGEIRTHGRHPTGRPWTIAIQGGATVELNDQAIATSGNYLQKWKVDGQTYFHIIDPKLKKPLEIKGNKGIASVTVVMNDCMTADALATALIVFDSKELAQEWSEAHLKHVPIWFIDNASWPGPFLASFPEP